MIAKLEESEWFVEELSKMHDIGNIIDGIDINMNFFVVDDIYTSKKREISEVTYEINKGKDDRQIIKFLFEHGYHFKRNTDLKNGFRSVSYMKERFI